jgi:hypothetical protein
MHISATLRTDTDSHLLQVLLELIRLRILGRRVQATRRYLAEPASNTHMGIACLAQTVAEHSATLSRLRLKPCLISD